LFRIWGIDVYLHWSWFVIAVYSIQSRAHEYSSLGWNVAEYLALFVTVLMHEFGHSLACRQVGGQADQIVLWPLGGVAYVAPPPRPGATLWSIAAGPLVNVVLFPLFLTLTMIAGNAGWDESHPDAYRFLEAMKYLNAGLLMFNLLPIYPLDGGQILRSLLWFPFGRARSLFAATVIGFIGVLALFGFAIFSGSVWLGVMSAFVLMNCWQGFMHARALLRIEKAPRRGGYACPVCGTAPIAGAIWRCRACGTPGDVFQSQGVCPQCGVVADAATCPDCGATSPLPLWRKLPPPPPV
jgi:Zn-dependent protease